MPSSSPDTVGVAVTDWRYLVDDARIQAVSITAPNFLHREIGSAFAAAGKHLWIEKPVGLSAADARAITGPGRVCVGFNYRHAPAVAKARDLLAAGAIGRVTHARFSWLSDYASSPETALSWRFLRSRGGNGVLGDLGAHAVDMVRHLLGEIAAALFLRPGRSTAATLADAIRAAEVLEEIEQAARDA